MRHSNRELWLSFYAIIGLSLFYLLVVVSLGSIPAASEFFGHSLGILGFILMIATETLYTLRKRSRSARWGRMSAWLQFHIFTGLVGPYMVLLHTSWKFNGLAGIVMLFTLIIVISGFIGRYIYTAVPRSADGIEIEAHELARQIEAADAELQRWLGMNPEAIQALSRRFDTQPQLTSNRIVLVLGRFSHELGIRLRWWGEKRRMGARERAQARELERLLRRKRTLQRQITSLAMARRLLGIWHTVHIPIGMVLFTAACVHIVAAVYYATLLR